MEDETAWEAGTAIAAFVLNVHMMNCLARKGIFTPEDASDIIDRAVLDVEERVGNFPEKYRQEHLEAIRILGSLRVAK